MRKIMYISGTRADFGLMKNTLSLLDAHKDIDISVAVTGMHLSSQYGETVREIEESNISIAARIPVELEPATGATMARALAKMINGFTECLETEKPDIVLLLGDRTEMLAAAISSIHLNIPIAHIHGGERSGTIDESIRHAISKLSHIHFVATAQSRNRLLSMGETPSNIFVTGAPGLDNLVELANKKPSEIMKQYGLKEKKPAGLFLFHPVVQEADKAGGQAREILAAILEAGWQILALMPNSDAGSTELRDMIDTFDHPDLHKIVHMPRSDFLSALKCMDVLIGNSSSGIIESASFGIPVINIGTRQQFRERNHNVMDVLPDKNSIIQALAKVVNGGKYPAKNLYGDGKAGERIRDLLGSVELGPGLMNKVMEH